MELVYLWVEEYKNIKNQGLILVQDLSVSIIKIQKN